MNPDEKLRERVVAGLPQSLFDSYAVLREVQARNPASTISPMQVADVLDAIVAIERGQRLSDAKPSKRRGQRSGWPKTRNRMNLNLTPVNQAAPTKPESEATFAGPLCSAQIPDHTGYHFRKCKRPAKWMIAAGPRCGLHARQWKTSRTLIAPNEKISGD